MTHAYRCAHILLKGEVIGVMGIIHPQCLQVQRDDIYIYIHIYISA